MTDDASADEQGRFEAVTPSPASPADERVARVCSRSVPAVLRSFGPWVLLLLATYALQRSGIAWRFSSAGARIGAQLAFIIAGFGIGLLLGSRDDFPWLQWPPEGTLQHRRTRLLAADLAHGGWRMLWLLPFLIVSCSVLMVMVILAVTQPAGLRPMADLATLLWDALLAAASGMLIGRMLLRPGAEAITARGIHTSPVSFVPWSALSHAIAEPDEWVIRLYAAKRPWVPRAVLTYRTATEAREAARRIATYLPSLRPEDEPPANRIRWAAFLGALLAIVVVFTWGAFRLLLLSMGDLEAAGPSLPFILALLVVRMPEVVIMLTLLAGLLFDIAVDEYRGVTTKRIVSEDP